MSSLGVVVCVGCGTVLSRPVEKLPRRPPPVARDEVSFHPTMAVGTWAVTDEPLFTGPGGRPRSTLGCLVLHPDDGRALQPHPDFLRNTGCCGHDAIEGPNRVCTGCRAEVATLSDDCWTVVELRFEPDLVRVEPV